MSVESSSMLWDPLLARVGKDLCTPHVLAKVVIMCWKCAVALCRNGQAQGENMVDVVKCHSDEDHSNAKSGFTRCVSELSESVFDALSFNEVALIFTCRCA